MTERRSLQFTILVMSIRLHRNWGKRKQNNEERVKIENTARHVYVPCAESDFSNFTE
jgi:hypothetical protein